MSGSMARAARSMVDAGAARGSSIGRGRTEALVQTAARRGRVRTTEAASAASMAVPCEEREREQLREERAKNRERKEKERRQGLVGSMLAARRSELLGRSVELAPEGSDGVGSGTS